MTKISWKALLRWTTLMPIIALAALLFTWGRHPVWWILVIEAILLVGAVLSAVHHAEIIAHRVGEPFGSLILAVAVTVIEVALIVTLMVSSTSDASTLARDTVFAAVMLTMNGIVGISLLVGSLKYRLAVFNPEGAGSALGSVILLASLTLVLPRFTTSTSEPRLLSSQLVFVAVASLVVYGLFVFTQTIRHRDFFLPPGIEDDDDSHAKPPSNRATLTSIILLPIALVSVVGLTKVESPAIEAGVAWLGFPHSFVGVIIAVMVLLPESIAAVRAASRNRTQISLNLGYGSAMASIGLTIPTLAIASHWLPGQLNLGLEPIQILLLCVSTVVAVLIVVPGRAKSLHATLLLALFSAFIFLAIVP
ncbi:MAG: ionic transporter y4hA [Propionibacteriaceae bacterium]|nr:ionic transporter y4hA [Propionibacteriaceae bacterium]